MTLVIGSMQLMFNAEARREPPTVSFHDHPESQPDGDQVQKMVSRRSSDRWTTLRFCPPYFTQGSKMIGARSRIDSS